MLIEIFEALGVRDKISALKQISNLQDDAELLQCLVDCGVNNWDGYGDASIKFYSKKEEN